MTRRPRRSTFVALGAAMALTASLAGSSLAQEAAPDLTSDITEYPNYGGEVDCEAGTFNGLPYDGNLKSITAPDAGTVVFEFEDASQVGWHHVRHCRDGIGRTSGSTGCCGLRARHRTPGAME